VTLGGRRVGVERPRVRSVDGMSEVPLTTYRHFSDRDPLTRVVLERMLAGVSTRRYRRTQDPIGELVEQRARSTSKSSISRAFVERNAQSTGLVDGPPPGGREAKAGLKLLESPAVNVPPLANASRPLPGRRRDRR